MFHIHFFRVSPLSQGNGDGIKMNMSWLQCVVSWWSAGCVGQLCDIHELDIAGQARGGRGQLKKQRGPRLRTPPAHTPALARSICAPLSSRWVRHVSRLPLQHTQPWWASSASVLGSSARRAHDRTCIPDTATSSIVIGFFTRWLLFYTVEQPRFRF